MNEGAGGTILLRSLEIETEDWVIIDIDYKLPPRPVPPYPQALWCGAPTRRPAPEHPGGRSELIGQARMRLTKGARAAAALTARRQSIGARVKYACQRGDSIVIAQSGRNAGVTLLTGHYLDLVQRGYCGSSVHAL